MNLNTRKKVILKHADKLAENRDKWIARNRIFIMTIIII